MAYAYVQEVDLHQANASSIAAPSITPNAAGDQFIICVNGGLNNQMSMTDNLGTHNVYNFIGNCNFPASNTTMWFWMVTSCQSGAQVITCNGTQSNISNILVAEYSGLSGIFSTIANANQNGAPTGANGTISGPVLVPTLPAMVWGIAFNTNGAGTLTAGTSPLAFTQEVSTMWGAASNGFEDARVTSGTSYQATFANTSGNPYCTAVIIFPEADANTATTAWLT